jgi:hypothetical protein
MKIEIVSGGKNEIPSGNNTSIKIDGKDISKNVTQIMFKIRAGQDAEFRVDYGIITPAPVYITKLKPRFRIADWLKSRRELIMERDMYKEYFWFQQGKTRK